MKKLAPFILALSLFAIEPIEAIALRAIAHVASATPVEGDPSPAELAATVTTGNIGVVTIEHTDTAAGTFSNGGTYEAPQSIAALGHSINIGVICNLTGGATTFTWTLGGGNANNMHFSEYSGGATSNCLDGTPVSGSNVSEPFPFTPSSVTLTGGGIVFCALLTTADPAMSVGNERSESDGGAFWVNTGERSGSGACTWTGTTLNPQLHILIGLEEAGGGGGPVFPKAIIINPSRGGGLRLVQSIHKRFKR